MSRQKKKKFAEVAARDNVLEPGKEIYEKIKGKWQTQYFKNQHPITVELACGWGEYTIGLADLFAKKNFVGVDIKGDRLWRGSGLALEAGMGNVAFLRTEILLLDKFFAASEIDELWITFPDPRPKDRDEKRRLIHPRFLNIYKKLIKKDGWVRLKTDNTGLFEYSLHILRSRKDVTSLQYTQNLYNSGFEAECHGIKTKYEKKHTALGETIKYLKFQFIGG